MDVGRLCVAVLLVVGILVSVGARNPGLKARITSNGLNYANKVAIEALTANVKTLTIPDQSGKASGFKYQIYNIHVTDFNPPSSKIAIVANKGLSWSADNAYIAVHGDFKYKALFVSGHGSFDAKVKGVSFSIQLNLGADGTGRPTISASGCNSHVSDVDFKFHGGASWLFNLFRSKVGNIIKDNLNGQMCKLINKAIDQDAESHLQKLKVTTPLGKLFLLDYSFTQAPQFQTEFFETFHKGEIYWKADPSTESPFSAPPITESADVSNMLYLWVSDYVFDTVGYAAQKHGFLVYNMTQKDLPAEDRKYLNTSCSSAPPCVGQIIPQIGQKFPDGVVTLNMSSTAEPKMKITSAGVALNFSGLISLYVSKPGAYNNVFLMTLGANMKTTVTVSIRNELLYAQIGDLQLKLREVKSAVGPIDETLFNFLINNALNLFLIPKLNEFGKRGFPLPVTDVIKFTNTKISFAQDSLMIGTDLNYTPTSEQPAPEDSDTLKFQSFYPPM